MHLLPRCSKANENQSTYDFLQKSSWIQCLPDISNRDESFCNLCPPSRELGIKRSNSEFNVSLLKVSQLSKNFVNLAAVSSISFELRAGEIYGLLGPNGAGKTTTISMISGLLKPDSGKVEIDGKDFWENPKRAQKMMGVVPQEVAVYEELTVGENLIFWGRLAGMPRQEARK